MKIAVVVYGQPREVIDSYPSIKENLLDNPNVEIDLFGHFWKSNDYNEALELYNFKDYISIKGFTSSAIDGGAATVYDLPLDRTKKLKQLVVKS